MKHIIFNENMLIAFFFEVCQGQLYVHVSKQQIKETKSHLIIVLGIMQGEIFKKLIRNYGMKIFVFRPIRYILACFIMYTKTFLILHIT